MPRLIEQPAVIAAAGNKPKKIEEYAGRVNPGVLAGERAPGLRRRFRRRL